VSLQTAAGFPLSAALVVTLTPPPQDGRAIVSPARLVKALAGDGRDVSLTELPAGPAVRVWREDPPVTNLDLHIPVPGIGSYLLLSFSTPLAPLASALVGMFRRDRWHPEVDPMSKDPGYELAFSVPPRWVRMPVLDNRKVLRHDRKVTAWSRQQAQAILGDGAPPGQLEQRATELAGLTYEARARGAMYGLALYAPPPDGLAAILDVKRLVPDRTYPELTFDVLRRLYAEPTADTLGDIEEKQVDLPSGPALRVHRKRAEPRDPTGQSLIIEGVTHAIVPPGIGHSIVMIMTWAALQLGGRLAEMADTIAATLEIKHTR
jgi:hypothetical protein